MIQRIVSMTFSLDSLPDFLRMFEDVRNLIRDQPGCQGLELWQSVSEPAMVFTLSLWDSEEDLDRYRGTPLFRDVWTRTKAMFAGKPQAWSIRQIA